MTLIEFKSAIGITNIFVINFLLFRWQ